MSRKGITMSSMTELFNSASAAEKTNKFKVEMIDIDDIEPNQKNEYSIEQIDELALSISLVGIRQNLEVMPIGNGKYRLLSGERRYTAVKKLVGEEGREDLRKVPCVVTVPDADIQMDIPDDIKELWLLTTTNSQREKTDADRLTDIRNQKKIYQALIDSGVELTGKQRDLIAEALKISPAQVQRFEFVDKNLSPELKAGFEKNVIPLTVAVEAAKQNEPAQRKLAKKLEKTGKLTKTDVDDIAKKEQKEDSGDIEYTLTVSDFEYLKALDKPIEEIIGESGKKITEREYYLIKQAENSIRKEQMKIAKILQK